MTETQTPLKYCKKCRNDTMGIEDSLQYKSNLITLSTFIVWQAGYITLEEYEHIVILENKKMLKCIRGN